MQLTMNHAEVMQYAHEKQYVTMMFMSASEDYSACRCCILNLLSSGFRLASEAVEKMLKSFIYLETEKRSRLRGNERHNPYLLKKELRETYRDQRLDDFDPLFSRLFDHYQTRYFDNPRSGEGAKGDELNQIDNLFIYLVETLPVPEEIRYRSKFFADLFDANARKFWRTHHWMTQQNLALLPKLETMERKYELVFRHLYPTAVQEP